MRPSRRRRKWMGWKISKSLASAHEKPFNQANGYWLIWPRCAAANQPFQEAERRVVHTTFNRARARAHTSKYTSNIPFFSRTAARCSVYSVVSNSRGNCVCAHFDLGERMMMMRLFALSLLRFFAGTQRKCAVFSFAFFIFFGELLLLEEKCQKNWTHEIKRGRIGQTKPLVETT